MPNAAIFGSEVAPPAHPHDRPLLRPLNQLGKPASMSQGVSFLRRTEYISSDVSRARVDGTPRGSKQIPRKRKAAEAERDDDPVRMLRGIYKGFDVAYPHDAYSGPDAGDKIRGDAVTDEDLSAWQRPRHPTNPDLTPLETYPILPDLDGFPDSGNYYVIKFATNPVAPSDTYDSRLDVTILRPMEPFPGALEQAQAQAEAYAADPSLPRPPPIPWNYDMYLPQEAEIAAIKTALDVNSSGKDDASLYSEANAESGRPFIRFNNQRTYETYQCNDYTEDQWGSTVALALHNAGDSKAADGSRRPLQTAAYMYPIVQRVGIRSKRNANVGGYAASQARNENRVDFLDVAVRDPLDSEVSRRKHHKNFVEDVEQEEAPPAAEAVEAA